MVVDKTKGVYSLVFENKQEFEQFNSNILESISVMSEPLIADEELSNRINSSYAINTFVGYLLAVEHFK